MEAIKFGANDVLIDTAKVTAGFWSGGTASMSGGFLIKSSSGQIDGGRFTLYGLAHS